MPATIDIPPRVLRMWRDHPGAWVDAHLSAHLWSKQVEILDSVRHHRRTAVRSCHGAGKSFTAAVVALWFLMVYPMSIVATSAPTWRQVKKIVWKEMRVLHRNAKLALPGMFSPKSPQLSIADGWEAFGFASIDPDAAQGLHAPYFLLLLDEPGGISKDVHTALEGALTGANARVLYIGNPTESSGPFFDEFKPGSPSNKIHISAADTPNVLAGREVIPGLVTREWVAEKEQKWGLDSPMYQARVLGEFPASGDDVLVPLSWWQQSCAREVEVPAGDTGVLSVDVAGGRGGAFSVIGHLAAARRYRTIYRRNTQDVMRLADEVALRQAAIGHGSVLPVARVDRIGIGDGVCARLHQMGRPVLPMDVSRPARDRTLFRSCRDEWFWHMRSRFDPTNALSLDVDDAEEDDLGAQVTGMQWGTEAGVIRVESKEAMAKRGMASPDDADACMMACAPVYGGGSGKMRLAVDSQVNPFAL